MKLYSTLNEIFWLECLKSSVQLFIEILAAEVKSDDPGTTAEERLLLSKFIERNIKILNATSLQQYQIYLWIVEEKKNL